MSQIVVGFDFDGTLYLTNEIKKKVFFLIASKFDNGETIMKRILCKYPILDRNEVFDLFSKQYKLSFPEAIPINPIHLSKRYSKICFSEITQNSIPRKGMKKILEFLLEKNIKCYLISATPLKDLNPIIFNLKLDQYFKSIFGSPISKEDSINFIISKENIPKDKFFYIGDAEEDYEATKLVKCKFIHISDNINSNLTNKKPIKDLTNLVSIFENEIKN